MRLARQYLLFILYNVQALGSFAKLSTLLYSY